MKEIMEFLKTPYLLILYTFLWNTFLIVLVAFILKKLMIKCLQHFKLKNEVILIKLTRITLNTLMILCICYQIEAFRTFMMYILASGGIVAIVVGLAAQEAFGNLVSGLMIIIFKPFQINDLIKINQDLIGTVVDISLRHTTIITYENTKVMIPNSAVNKATLENINAIDTKGNYLILSISYESDLDLAIQLIQDEVIKHPSFIDTRTIKQKEANEPPVVVRCTAFNASSVELKCVIQSATNSLGYAMLSDLRISLKKLFKENNIEIPYPHITLTKK